jgi:hypothetical protein
MVNVSVNSTTTTNIHLLIIPRMLFTVCVVSLQSLCPYFCECSCYFVYFSLENWKHMCTYVHYYFYMKCYLYVISEHCVFK